LHSTNFWLRYHGEGNIEKLRRTLLKAWRLNSNSCPKARPPHFFILRRLTPIAIEERQLRVKFNEEHGAYFPADLCLCIENLPTKWEVVPQNGEAAEVLPHIDNDLLLQVGRLVLPCLFSCSVNLGDRQ
jgi:hypothetical protein